MKFFLISRIILLLEHHLPGEPTHPTPHHRDILHHGHLCSAARLSGAAADKTGGGAVNRAAGRAGFNDFDLRTQGPARLWGLVSGGDLGKAAAGEFGQP